MSQQFPPATPEFYFHLLRHLRYCPYDFLLHLAGQLNKGVSELKAQMQMHGSYFYQSFAENPDQLYQRIIKQIQKEHIKGRKEGVRMVYEVPFDEQEFPEGIGLDALVPMKEVENYPKSAFYKLERSGFQVWTLKAPLLKSWKANLILFNKVPVTIFSGTYAPPFPDTEKMTSDAYRFAQVFWESHALIDAG